MITFKRYLLAESIIDPLRKSLDRKIFPEQGGDEPRINPTVEAQIRAAIRKFETLAPVHDFYLVGSILSRRYNDDSDLDVTVEILKDDVDDETEDALYDMLDDINGQMADGSTHPINYHFNFVDDDEDLSDNFDNIYDFSTETWKKRTDDRHVDPEEFMDEFQEKVAQLDINSMEIKRDIVDIDRLRKFSKDEIEGLVGMVEDKLDDIEDNIEEMVDSEEEIADLRRDAFADITPAELKRLGSKNALPINIVYKLMERYYYWELISALKDILDEDDGIEEDDLPEIKSAFRKFDDRVYGRMDDVGSAGGELDVDAEKF